MNLAGPRELPFDLADERFIADPYPALGALREAAPLVHDERLGRWFLTRHADVRACLRDKRLGRNFRHVGSETEFHAEPLDPRFADFWASERWSLLWLEPPEHTRIRKLVAAAFTPRAVEGMRAPAAALARSLLESLGESFDLLYDYAQPYSITLICALLGVPTDRHRDLLDWSHAIVKMYEFDTTDEQAVAANDAARAFRAYVTELIEERRAEPRDDMVSGLVQARVDGERLSDDEIVSTVVVLLNAGHEATVNTVGNGVRALAAHPGEWERLVSGEVAAAQAIEELIRWDPPLQLFERWVLEDGVEIAGTPVPRGEKIALLFGSASRDPRVFAEPDRLDLARANAAEHIGFGGGIHVCIGAPLARIELAASFEALAELRPALHLVEQPRRVPAFVIRGFRSVRVAG
ncbi:MAG: cytochrome P450 [Acidobacteriota bacterium]|nr:cytochrome P450 [Acidobacteriota bacterium]